MSKEVTPNNWPDPTRPGVPMFPEKTLRHALKKKDSGEIIIRNWKSDGDHWDMIGYSAQWCSETYFYEGPILTPTQIAEMLAGERRRCADVCKADAHRYREAGERKMDAASFECSLKIRKLGDAP